MARTLLAETLQPRELMASDTAYLPYHNYLIPTDTNGDNKTTAIDALLPINEINQNGSRPLNDITVGSTSGPYLDVNGDGYLSPIDVLEVINAVNRNVEGAGTPIVGFSYQIADQNGNPIANNTVSKGQLFQVRTFVQDLRGFGAQGIFAAFLDLDYSDASKFSVQVGEIQSFRYFYDNLRTDDPTSAFKFQFGTDPVVSVNMFNQDGSPRDADQTAAAIQAGLESSPSIGVGNVIVRVDQVAQAQDQKDGITTRNNLEIRFVNGKAAQNVPLLQLDTSGIKVTNGTTFQFELADKTPADPSNPTSFAAAFIFSNEFGFNRTAVNGTNKFDEVGAATGLGAPSNKSASRLLFYVTLRANEAGEVTFTPNQAGDATEGDTAFIPAHDVLVFPKDTVTRDLVNYGNPFKVTIVDNLVANADSFAVEEDSGSTQFNVTANDQLFSGNAFSITTVGATDNGGTATLVSTAGGQRINYTPAANFFGTEKFTYTITNNLGSSTGTVTVNVTPINDPITVSNKSFNTNLGVPLSINGSTVVAGGSVGPGESNDQTLSVQSVLSAPTSGGTATLANGVITYTPPASFSGTDTFVVVVTDSGSSTRVVSGVAQAPASDPKTQNVTITVTVVNNAPDAVNDLLQDIDEDSSGNSLDVRANDSAGVGDNDELTIIAVGPRSQGGLVTIAPDGKSLVYTPGAGVTGVETFTYTVRDRGGLTDMATVTIELQPTVLPRARTDSATVAEDSVAGVTIPVLANDRTNKDTVNNVDFKAILVSIGSPTAPKNGTISIDDNGTPADKTDDKVVYKPAANFFGVDTFSYEMDDLSSVPGKQSSTGLVTVTVTPVNDVPVLTNDQVVVGEDQTPDPVILASTLFSNDSVGDGEALVQELAITSVSAVSATGGSVALVGGNVVYTPLADFNGQFVFTYTVIDKNKDGAPLADALPATGRVTITVTSVNDKPIAGVHTVSTAEDTSLPITAASLTNNDKPGPATATDEVSQTLTITAVSPGSEKGGSVSLNAGVVTYTPAPDFFGTDTFTYVVADNGSPVESVTATVTVTVTPVNDAPIATADTAVAFKGVPLTINGASLLANDRPGPANESSQTLTITSVTANANTRGTVVLGAGGAIVYTPEAGYTGAASFDYAIQDNGVTGTTNDFKSVSSSVSVDVKEFVPSSIAGSVYWDQDAGGTRNAGERAIGGVVIALNGTAFGQPVSLTTRTLADGTYSFDQLAPGSYTVSFATPGSLVDGADNVGSHGDTDGIANNNQFGLNIVSPGGVNATNYNFAVKGIAGGYGSVLDRLATNYFVSSSTQSLLGANFVIGRDNSAKWFSNMSGFENVLFAEAVSDTSMSKLYVTIVDNKHDVYTATLGKGKFLSMFDDQGNTIIRVLGGMSQLPFLKVNYASPPVDPVNRYLDSIDDIFGQEGW